MVSSKTLLPDALKNENNIDYFKIVAGFLQRDKFVPYQIYTTQSAEAGEYNNCDYAEWDNSPTNVLAMTLNPQMVRLQSVDLLGIAFTPKSTLTRSDSTW